MVPGASACRPCWLAGLLVLGVPCRAESERCLSEAGSERCLSEGAAKVRDVVMQVGLPSEQRQSILAVLGAGEAEKKAGEEDGLSVWTLAFLCFCALVAIHYCRVLRRE